MVGALSVNKVTGSSTNGGLDIVDHRLPQGYAPPPHVHDDSDEVFIHHRRAVLGAVRRSGVGSGPGIAGVPARGLRPRLHRGR